MALPKIPIRLMGLTYAHHLWWWRNAVRKRTVVTEWNEKHQAIFIHIPKTAGTSIMSRLGMVPVHDSHAPAQIYAEAYPDLYRRAYKFTFVRNPWDRFASSFHFLKHGTEWELQRDWARRHIGDLNFAGFTRKLRNPLFRAIVLSERFFWPQTVWLGGVGSAAGVDEIFRFEALDPAIQALSARFDVPQGEDLPHLRRVVRADFRELYDQEMIDIVGKLYREDIATLGYSFDMAGQA
jgi:hypothetical protein